MGTLCSLYLYTCITVSVIMAHEVGHIRVVRIRKLKLPRDLRDERTCCGDLFSGS